MRYLALGIILGVGGSCIIEAYYPSTKNIVSIIVVGCFVLGMFVKEHFDKKKEG